MFDTNFEMKIQLEAIRPDSNSSFHLMENPRLNDFFYWHFHPEIELTFIDGADGTRHVGSHISQYSGSDLVLIGSNIPHLNFDYGVKSEYEKTVLHIQPDFLSETFVKTPELGGIRLLFEKSACGIAFGEKTKPVAGAMLKKLHRLPPFEQLVEVLRILNLLSESPDMTLLHDTPVRNQYNKKAQERLKNLYRFIDENYQRKIGIAEAAAISRMTEVAFCRYFKKMTRLTFTDFLNRYRINEAKRLLLMDKNVSEACYACGFESLSYFNRVFRRVTEMNPGTFKSMFLK